MTHYTTFLLMFTFLLWPSPKTPALEKPQDPQIEQEAEWFKKEIEKLNQTLDTNPVMSLHQAQKLLAYAKNHPRNPWLVAKAKERIGICYYYLHEISLSNKYNFESLLLFDSLNDIENKALVLNNIGWNFRIQDKNEQAILHFEQSLELFEKLDDTTRIQGILNNLGTAYRREPGMKRRALEVFHKSLKMNKTSGNHTWEAYNYNNIGLIHLDLSEYDSAMTFFRRSLSVNAETGNEEEQCKNLLNIGLTFSYMGQADSANAYFKNARAVLDRNDFPKTEYVYWDYQYDFNYNTGNYKEALEANIKKNTFEWDQHKNEYENKIAELEVRYDMAIKDKELSEAQKRLRQTETIALLALLVSIIVILIKVYIEKTKWLNKSKALYDQINEKVQLLRNLNEENERIKNNLEKLVKQETERVTRQNEKLRKFAFINSHTIRGPVARILGLINIMTLENDHLKNNTAFSKLYESSNELDKVIRRMGDVLADDD